MASALRVLVAEDEDNVRFVVAAALRIADYQVVEVTSGTEALRLVSHNGDRPDVAVLDVMLPSPDGFEVCERMRSLGIGIPVIFLTARDATHDRIRGLTIGGDDYLTKPFSVEELVARVGAVLRRSGKAPSTELLQAGTLELDDGARTVLCGRKPLELSPTQYKLMRFFMRNFGRALSRGQILDHVWDYDFDGETTVIESFVSELRKKLKQDGAPVIRTVRGFGYRLDPP